jgi:hypothetical protein
MRLHAQRILAAAASLACAAAFAASEAEIVDLAKRAASNDAAAKVALEKLAGEGETLAEHFMGVLYIGGKGVSQSDSQAVDWFLRAARKGHLESMHNLGVIYERTTGTLKDTDAARAWYRQAAEKGFARSQARLGEMLLAGIGGTPDSELARQWIEKSAAQNEPRGEYLLAMLKLEGRAGVERDEAEAARLMRLAAAANHGASVVTFTATATRSIAWRCCTAPARAWKRATHSRSSGCARRPRSNSPTPSSCWGRFTPAAFTVWGATTRPPWAGCAARRCRGTPRRNTSSV